MAKKTLNITLYYSELMYDVQNKTYLTGKSRETGDNFEAVANMQANDDEENKNQILRSIGNAVSALKARLSEYIIDAGDSSSNILQVVEDAGKLELSLSMPSNYNNATRDTISAAAHQFIVNTAIGDWFAITNKADASDYVAQATANIIEIREAISKRVRPTRPEINS
jgi:hypothetical protein